MSFLYETSTSAKDRFIYLVPSSNKQKKKDKRQPEPSSYLSTLPALTTYNIHQFLLWRRLHRRARDTRLLQPRAPPDMEMGSAALLLCPLCFRAFLLVKF